MIISHANGFVMLAPWKTASSTLHARLSRYNESPYSRFYYLNPFLNRVVHQHVTCGDFASLPESRRQLFVASFVRNPYDRAYSGFLQLQRDIRIQPMGPFAAEWIRDLVKRQLADNLEQLARADFDFNRWVAGLTEEQIYEVGRNSSFSLHPAHYWTHVDGDPYVSFIGRVEAFEADFTDFCGRVGIAPPIATNENVSAPIAGSAPPGGAYRYTGLMDRAAVDKINHLFRADFELFGYRPI
jgi:hypothetical protein